MEGSHVYSDSNARLVDYDYDCDNDNDSDTGPEHEAVVSSRQSAVGSPGA